MAIIKPEEISEEVRHDIITGAIVSDAPAFDGFVFVRHVSPLVLTALQRANNPYITARKGFDAMGVKFDEEGQQVTDNNEFGLLMMSKTAEVLILLSCTREELKKFAVDPLALESAALDILDRKEMSIERMAEATYFVAEEIQKLSKAKAVKSPEEEKPSATTLEGGVDGSKKQPPIG